MVCLSGDQCFSFYPFLWAKEGSLLASRRKIAPVHEVFDLKLICFGRLNPTRRHRSYGIFLFNSS